MAEEDARREMRSTPTGRASARRAGAPPRFADRAEAGRALLPALEGLLDADTRILGIPRGGVVVAAQIADALGLALDVVVARKLGAPGNPELAIGAVADGVQVVDEGLAERTNASFAYLDAEIDAQQQEVRRRTVAYREGRADPSLVGRVTVVVDDGIATGATAIAAVRWCRAAGVDRVILAAPVASAQIMSTLAEEADEVVVLAAPRAFRAVGQYYERFDQVADADVTRILRAHPEPA